MQPRGDSFLRHIEGLIKEGKKNEARPLLAAYVQRHPESARAWWLLSLLLSDEKQQIDCLERVLQLDPASALARTRLAKLKGAADLLPEPKPDYSPYVYDPAIEIPSPNIFEPVSFDESPPAVIPEPVSAPAPEISKPVSVARASAPRNTMPRPAKKNSTLPMAALLALFCLVMVALGAAALWILSQNQAAVPVPTLFFTETATLNPVGWSLPPTWTPAVIPVSPLSPSLTPWPTQTPLSLAPGTPLTGSPAVRVIGAQNGLYAPDFSLKDLSGRQVSLADYSGSPVVLVFFTTWCPYCAQEMSSLQPVYEDFQDSSLVVLGVDCGDSASQVRSYKKSHNLTFPVLLDPKSRTLALYQSSSFPTHFFIDPGGRISYIAVGALEQASLKNRINNMLAGRQ